MIYEASGEGGRSSYKAADYKAPSRTQPKHLARRITACTGGACTLDTNGRAIRCHLIRCLLTAIQGKILGSHRCCSGWRVSRYKLGTASPPPQRCALLVLQGLGCQHERDVWPVLLNGPRVVLACSEALRRLLWGGLGTVRHGMGCSQPHEAQAE